MNNAKNILIAVDDSAASYRAVTYVGSLMGGRKDCRVCLVHASPPLPRELLEFGGSSDPQHEAREEARIHAEQARWLETVRQAAAPVFTRAQRLLHEAGVPADAVETQMTATVNPQDIVLDMLEAARAQQCGTVVVGREAVPGLRARWTAPLSERLMRQAHDLTVWVVE
jgi:nucleotide-binding universal stress UspA family protein